MIAALLALLVQGAQPAPSADGARLFRRCVACHALEAGRNNPAGPTLHAIVGRRVAAEPGFRYSPALQAYALRHPRWTEAELDHFLADPQTAVPGTDMGFPGIADPAQRRISIDWLGDPHRRMD
jgi:cytochrome c